MFFYFFCVATTGVMKNMCVDINPTSYSKLEGQMRMVTDKELFVIAKILGTSVDALFEPSPDGEGGSRLEKRSYSTNKLMEEYDRFLARREERKT